MGKIEIQQNGENEFLIGENRAIINGENLVHIVAVGEQTDEMANLQKELLLRLVTLVPGKMNILVDLNKSGKNSPYAREMWNKMDAHEKINKVAVFGMTPVSRVIASFVLSFSKNSNQRFFKTKEEAMIWLNKQEI